MSLAIGENPKQELKLLLSQLGTEKFFELLSQVLTENPQYKEQVYQSTWDQVAASVRVNAAQAHEDALRSAFRSTDPRDREKAEIARIEAAQIERDYANAKDGY